MSKDKKLEFTDDNSINDFFEETEDQKKAVASSEEEEVTLVSKSSEEEITLDNKSSDIKASEEEEVSPEALEKDEEKPKAKKEGKKKFYLSVYDVASIIMSSFVIIAIIFTFAFRLVGVEGSSMTNTLHEGDWLIAVNKAEYVPGDIVVITQDTYFHEPLIKRVIATEGQVIDVDYSTATFFVDGKPLDEPYVKEDFLVEKADYIPFPYTVPDGCLFCMGDNRNGSSDSRTTYVGPIDKRQILGKAVVRLLPFGDFNIYDYE